MIMATFIVVCQKLFFFPKKSNVVLNDTCVSSLASCRDTETFRCSARKLSTGRPPFNASRKEKG